MTADKPTQAMSDLQIKVTAQGIQFGNAWYSHEKITGYTAEQLNAGDCHITGRAYMEWVQSSIAAPAEKVTADAGGQPDEFDAFDAWWKTRVGLPTNAYHGWMARAALAQPSEAAGEPVDYDRVVSICEAHGIGLPVDCVEMVVEIIRLATPPS